ncbi:MAG: protein-L-isoaspartate(D-aspartate) O-methyltransferase, partial [Planctomycetota bacterium]
MATNYPKSFRKWIYLFLPLLLLIVILLTISADKSSPKQRQKPAEEKAKSEEKQEEKDKKTSRPEHKHPAFSERKRERERMVAKDIQWRDVSDPNVLDSMRIVPRHAFVRDRDLRRAYNDTPLPIGLGQTISQPYIVAYMTEALKLSPKFKVLEIGTGSGYQAAVCAEIVKEVYTIEILEELADLAKKRLKDLGYKNVSVKASDGYFGWAEYGPFDAIIVTCAAGFVPPPLVKQLKAGGRMILPVGSPFGAQWLVLITKDDKGKVQSKEL